jgi:hypothetical protein
MIDLISGKTPKVQRVQKVEPTFSLIKDYGVKNYLRTSKSLPHVEDKPWRFIATMPYNCHFQPIIELESKPGQSVSLNSTNPLVQYLTPTETVTTSGGNQRIEAKNWVSGEGGVQNAGSCVMGTLDMLGSKFLSILILMGIWAGADGGDISCGVTPLRRWGGELSTLT